ncbi:conserved exported hypothetical protein [Burkholderiales bacterium]|nr:conserved exported hypothetical protein [Burkholderiales bacterium]
MNPNFIRKAALATALLAGAAAQAQIPASAPYYTDPQNEYVQDDTSQGISSLNMVLCVIGGMDPGDLVNAGPYIALVDVNGCNAKGGGSNNSAAGATNFATAVVDVTRASNSDPMIAKVWLSMTEQGGTTNVYAYLSASQSPTAAPPYGVFRMDYIGKKNGQAGFNGTINSQPGLINFLEIGSNSSNTALAMSATSTTSGAGTMSVGSGSSNFNFAYDSGYFRRSDGTNDECFDRSKTHASISVWQYGTYNANDGTRVDMAHPGFPVLANYAGTSYYGYANYWGINFQGLDLNSVADASPISGLAVTDQRPGNTTSYALSKVGGKLTKWTQQSTTLGSLDGIPFTFGMDLTGLTTGNLSVTGWGNWVAQWSTANQNFTVVGTQNCGSSGCVVSSISPVATVNVGAFNSVPISGWANSYGGNLNIPPTGSPHATGDAVYYYNQSTVIPGSASLTLYCLNQCPTAAQLAAFSAGNSSTTPFGNGTDQQWFSAPSSANTVTYTFGVGGLMESAVPVVLEQASQFPSGSQYAQNGIQTGWLLDTAFGSCPAGYPGGSVCQPANPATYYTWQTGPQQWNQSLWLTTGGNVVPFDPPQNIAYTVPSGASYGSYAGLPILLQFDGFGNLNGIPGYCVSPVDNSTVNCNTPNSRYVPLFSIPDGSLMSLPNPPTPLIVKALNGEIRLGLAPGQCSSMTLTPLALPSGGLHDPSSPSDSEYLGTMPIVTVAPKVIDGVVQ